MREPTVNDKSVCCRAPLFREESHPKVNLCLKCMCPSEWIKVTKMPKDYTVKLVKKG